MDNDFEKDLKEFKKLYQITFDTEEGKLVIADLKLAYYHRGSFIKNDPYETAYREGQRSVLIRILNFMEDNNG
jgi:hypothetical protein|tara:strand:+ start:608 stop:826 length:219 start_codon:yes stop_codon:yes gene_type:complete